MRFIVYGAGAVGGVIGARLFGAGNEVVLIARGAHLEAIQRDGLCFESPGQRRLLRIPAVGSPGEVRFAPADVVIMAMKTQDTAAALDALLAAAGPGVPVVCAQNGVANERLAAARFENVYGILVILPATHLEPGTVRADTGPVTGILDAGRYAEGKDRTIAAVARALEGATFRARARDRIMPWKHAKLLSTLGNALQAACGLDADTRELARELRAEALACYRAAGIACTSEWNMRRRRVVMVAVNAAASRGGGGWDRLGGSTWQSLQRGAGTLETDYLNGEIVELGRAHGVPTPANAALQRIAARLVAERRPPGSMTVEELRREVGVS